MGKKKRRTFKPSFEKEVVELCRRGDRSIGRVAVATIYFVVLEDHVDPRTIAASAASAVSDGLQVRVSARRIPRLWRLLCAQRNMPRRASAAPGRVSMESACARWHYPFGTLRGDYAEVVARIPDGGEPVLVAGALQGLTRDAVAATDALLGDTVGGDGDYGPGLDAKARDPFGMAVAPGGHLVFADRDNASIRVIWSP